MTTVVPLEDALARRAAAKAKHPAGSSRPVELLDARLRASLIVTLARTWDAMHDLFRSNGRDDDQAHSTLMGLAAALVHPEARSSLCFTWLELRGTVDRLDAIERGDISHKDIGDCGSYDEAMADAASDVDFEVWPLLTGQPTRDACRGCRNRLPVHQWRVQGDCPDHTETRL